MKIYAVVVEKRYVEIEVDDPGVAQLARNLEHPGPACIGNIKRWITEEANAIWDRCEDEYIECVLNEDGDIWID